MGQQVVAALGGKTVPARDGVIFHPLVDFLCLGGLSLCLVPLLLVLPVSAAPAAAVIFLFLADLVNNPHFAHSYQIFYRDFRARAFGDRLGGAMQIRYQFAGIAVPLLLIAFLVVALSRDTPQLLGYGANAMFLLVGWHYAKQGYGMLMVDAVFKRRFFNDTEKRILLWNAHACWVMFWMLANHHAKQYDLWGVAYYSFDLPDFVRIASVAVASTTTAAALYVLLRKVVVERKQLPWNGVMAYVLSAYLWLAARYHPIALLAVPAFHSLQYLLIVWRYEINRTRATAREHPRSSPRVRLLAFGSAGILMGLAGFWWLPKLAAGSFAIDLASFGDGVWLFVFWIFINIHHYFIDNVIWRGENPDARAYLFAAPR